MKCIQFSLYFFILDLSVNSKQTNRYFINNFMSTFVKSNKNLATNHATNNETSRCKQQQKQSTLILFLHDGFGGVAVVSDD